ncbi:MAG: ribosome assembly factor SBDS [Candidatus Pacearchaeota archaeon]
MRSVARLKKLNKDFEIILEDVEKALELKEKLGKIDDKYFIEQMRLLSPSLMVFIDEKKGLKPTKQDLEQAFGTTDFFKIAKEILKDGEIVLPAEYRKKIREEKLKQVIAWLSRNAIDPRTKSLHTPERIEAAIKQAGIKIDEFKPVELQMHTIINQLSRILPIKIEIRKIEITIPSMFTGKAYNLISKFNKISEEWLDDGSLKVILTLPSALMPEFFDKLNKTTSGTALTKDLGEV